MANATISEPDVMSLSVDVVRALVLARTVSPSGVSPLASLLRESGRAAESVPDLGSFRASLDVLAQPQAYVRILILKPDADEEVVGLLVRDGQGVSFSMADGGVQLGHVQPLEALVLSLVPSLVHQGPLAGGEAWLWPSVVQLLTGLWQDQPDPADRLARKAVIDRLATPEFSAEEAEKLLASVSASGAVAAEGDELVMDAGLRPWLALLWSGHSVQIELVPLPEDASLEQAIEGPSDHVLFIGPPGERVRNEVVTGEALVRHLGGRQSRETSILHLDAPRSEEIAMTLRGLLKVGPTG